MLIQLKSRQRNIASVTLSLFLGSWLLLLCQTCMALVDDVNNLIGTTEVSDCHVPEDINTLDEVITENDEHCLGVCDCDDLSVTTNSENNYELKNKIKILNDLYAFTNPLVYQPVYSPPDNLISTQPERAIFLPFKRFTVLLN